MPSTPPPQDHGENQDRDAEPVSPPSQPHDLPAGQMLTAPSNVRERKVTRPSALRKRPTTLCFPQTPDWQECTLLGGTEVVNAGLRLAWGTQVDPVQFKADVGSAAGRPDRGLWPEEWASAINKVSIGPGHRGFKSMYPKAEHYELDIEGVATSDFDQLYREQVLRLGMVGVGKRCSKRMHG